LYSKKGDNKGIIKYGCLDSIPIDIEIPANKAVKLLLVESDLCKRKILKVTKNKPILLVIAKVVERKIIGTERAEYVYIYDLSFFEYNEIFLFKYISVKIRNKKLTSLIKIILLFVKKDK
jgi:hypothetical protein